MPAPTAPRAVNVVASLSGAAPSNWETREGDVRLVSANAPHRNAGKVALLGFDQAVPGTDKTAFLPLALPSLSDLGREVLTLEMPIPPSVNAIWRSRAIPTNRKDRFGRTIYVCSVYMTPEGKEWKADAVRAFASARVRFHEDAKVIVEARAFWPDARGRDMNNLAKITCDALQESGVVANDKRILWREMDFMIDRSKPRLRLDIRAAVEVTERKKP